MSSTTSPLGSHPATRRRDRERGQVLFIFTGGLVAFLAVAALVYDVGQNLLDWRAQRNAADAATLAGARYIADSGCVAAPSIANCPGAYQAAIRVAAENGYGDTDGDLVEDHGHVEVHIPPILADPVYRRPGFLEVTIHTDRPSFFASVLGMLRQNVTALAVAGNSKDVAPPYSMLALNPDCDPNPSGQVGGNGDVTVGGSVVVNSNCDGALLVNGNGTLGAPECDVAGTAQESGSNANLDCSGNLVEGFSGAGDPLAGIGPGSQPGTPAAVEILKWNGGGTPTIPPGCPGSTSQISYVGAAYAAGNTVALPAYAGGDLAVVYAYRAGNNNSPTVPAGWTPIAAGNGADSNSRAIGWKILTGVETTTDTWTAATAVEVVIVRGEETDGPIGVTASGGGAGTTLTTPGLLGMRTDGHSWVLAFAGATAGANAATLSGTTNHNGAVSSLGLATGQNLVTWLSRDYTGSVTGPNRTDAVEILANPNPSTNVNPAGCTLQGAGAGKYNVFRLHPGTYFGGIQLSGRTARVYLAPGTYWLAGGGLSISGRDNQLVSVDGAGSTTPGRGVFIYDTEDTYYHDACIAGTAPARACISGINANGGSSNECTNPPQPNPYDMSTAPATPCQWVHLDPTDSPIANLLVFVDRDLPAVDVFFNGNAGLLQLAGTIYDPNGQVSVTGGAGDTMAAQIIAFTFKITGNGGFDVTYDAGGIVHLAGVGLVQ